MSAVVDVKAPEESGHDVLRAVRNAFKLGGSLAVTWSIALAVRLLLPRLLGPESFGGFSFADSFVTMCFVTLGLGVDVYIRKEVAVRRERASDFFGAITLVQAALAAVLIAVMVPVLRAGGHPDAVRRAVYVFAAAQLLVSVNTSLAAMLHSVGEVDGLSVVNVVSKVIWGATVFGAVAFTRSLPLIASALLLSDLAKAIALGVLARRHLGLRFRVDLRAAKVVVLASLPFYINIVAYTAYARLDQSVLSFLLHDDAEVGWYAAAMNLAGLSMMVSPIVGWVLMPLYARALSRSRAEFEAVVRRSTEIILVIAIAIALGMSVGADVWIRTMFGEQFAPAVRSLQILAPMFVLTYFASLMGTVLIIEERGWTVMAISCAALAFNFVLNLLLVGPSHRAFGEGGGGIGSSIAQVLTEVSVAVMMTLATRGRMVDARMVGTMCRALLACAIVGALHYALRPLGPARVAVDAVACLGLMFALRVVRVGEYGAFVRMAWKRRSAQSEPEPDEPPAPARVKSLAS